MATGMDIPETRDSGCSITIHKRGAAHHEVQIEYANMPIKRYTLAFILAKFFSFFMNGIPSFGLWAFFPTMRKKILTDAYKHAIDATLKMLQQDVGDAILEG